MNRMKFNVGQWLAGLAVAVSLLWLPVSGLAAQQGAVLSGAEKQAYISAQMNDFWQKKKPIEAFAVPEGWQWEKLNVDGARAELFKAEEKQSDRVLLHLHGGGYVAGLNDFYRREALKDAQLAGAFAVYSVDYRLAPKYVYPAALEDAVKVYQGMLKQGIEPNNIIVLGDSAGGNLAVALSLYLKEHSLPQPAALVLQSPWADFEHKQGTSRYFNEDKDQVLGIGTPLNGAVKKPLYAGDLPLDDPRLSIINADLSSLPPMLIQAGGNDLFLTECQELAQKAAADGVNVTLSVYAGMPHDFAVLLPQMDDSLKSMQEIRAFADRYTGK